jgi:hypothetical protein
MGLYVSPEHVGAARHDSTIQRRAGSIALG